MDKAMGIIGMTWIRWYIDDVMWGWSIPDDIIAIVDDINQ